MNNHGSTYAHLKNEIQELAEISNSVPEPFRTRCFEILLQHFLSEQFGPKASSANIVDTTNSSESAVHDNASSTDIDSRAKSTISGKLPTPSQVKVFMGKTNVSIEELERIVIFEDNEVHFVAEPSTTKISQGQIEWALLTALKSAIENKGFSVDPEKVRSVCQDKGFYDSGNFITNFKRGKNGALFQGALEAQGEAQKLTNAGLVELGKLVKGLSAQSS